MPIDKYAQTASGIVGAAVRSLALNVGGGDQILAEIPTAFLCTTAGNLAGRLRDDAADTTVAMLAGVKYDLRYQLARQTGTTAAGFFLFAT